MKKLHLQLDRFHLVIGLFVLMAIAFFMAMSSHSFGPYIKGASTMPVVSGPVRSSETTTQTATQQGTSSVAHVSYTDPNTLEWTNVSNYTGKAYKIFMLEEATQALTATTQVYTNAVGTFSHITQKNTASGIPYYSGMTPTSIISSAGTELAYSVSASATTTLSYALPTQFQMDKNYTFIIETYDNSKLDSYSLEAVIVRGIDILHPPLPFKDVPQDAWYYEYVAKLLKEGLIQESDYYNPGRTTRKAEAAKFAVVAMGLTPSIDDAKIAAAYYSDVNESDWFAPYVGQVMKHVDTYLGERSKYPTGIYGGAYEEFNPSYQIRRKEVAQFMVYKFLDYLGKFGKSGHYKDVPSSLREAAHIEYAAFRGLFDVNVDSFNPWDFVTRAQMAKITVKAIENMRSDVK